MTLSQYRGGSWYHRQLSASSLGDYNKDQIVDFVGGIESAHIDFETWFRLEWFVDVNSWERNGQMSSAM